ncbi:hypothetical protein G0U57_017925, partial [Chelydra serpentina]
PANRTALPSPSSARSAGRGGVLGGAGEAGAASAAASAPGTREPSPAPGVPRARSVHRQRGAQGSWSLGRGAGPSLPGVGGSTGMKRCTATCWTLLLLAAFFCDSVTCKGGRGGARGA